MASGKAPWIIARNFCEDCYAAGAIIIGFLGYNKASIIIIGGTFVAMILLYAFSAMVASNNPAATIPGIILLYSVILFFCCFLAFTVTAFAFRVPEAWAQFLGIAPAAAPPPRIAISHIGPATLQPGETRNLNINLERGGPVDLIIQSVVSDWTSREAMREQWRQEGRGNTPELFVNVCSAAAPCPAGEQRGAGTSLRRDLPAGPASIHIFNFRENPVVTFTALYRHPE